MEAPKCRLFLRVARFAGAKECFAAALDAGDVASLLIAREEAVSLVDHLLPLARSNDVAVLIEDDVRLCEKFGADGVEVADAQSLREARSVLGRERIVGVRSASRHAAMEAAEAGGDYMAFPAEPGINSEDRLIAWWSPLFVVPCVTGYACEPDEARQAALAGADFVRPSDRMWESAEAARDVCRSTMAALERIGA